MKETAWLSSFILHPSSLIPDPSSLIPQLVADLTNLQRMPSFVAAIEQRPLIHIDRAKYRMWLDHLLERQSVAAKKS